MGGRAGGSLIVGQLHVGLMGVFVPGSGDLEIVPLRTSWIVRF